MLAIDGLGQNGSLGNQMFQFATLYAAGKRTGFDIAVQPCKEWWHGGCSRTISQITATFPKINKFVVAPQSHVQFTKKVVEPAYSADRCAVLMPECMSPADNTIMRGYFQNYDYFDEYKADLVDLFAFSPEVESRVRGFIGSQWSQNLHVLHVRRGDYLYLQHAHPVLSIEYYRKAISSINDIRINIIAVSDDKAWCKAQGFVTTPDDFSYAEDLCLITKANYVTIANSSYSWWGAYLNGSVKRVFRPQSWFGPVYGCASIPMPNGWEIV